MARGWWNMACWNGLSEAQQRRLIEHGNLPIDYVPEGTCQNGAEVEITTQYDEAPGPRFYCRGCGAEYLSGDVREAARELLKTIKFLGVDHAPNIGHHPEWKRDVARLREVIA